MEKGIRKKRHMRYQIIASKIFIFYAPKDETTLFDSKWNSETTYQYPTFEK